MKLGLRRGQLGLADRQHRLELAIVGPEERSAGLDVFTFLDEDLGDHAGNVHADRDILAASFDQARPRDHLDRVGPGRRLDDRLGHRLRPPRLDDPVDRENHTGDSADIGKTIFVNMSPLKQKITKY